MAEETTIAFVADKNFLISTFRGVFTLTGNSVTVGLEGKKENTSGNSPDFLWITTSYPFIPK